MRIENFRKVTTNFGNEFPSLTSCAFCWIVATSRGARQAGFGGAVLLRRSIVL